MRMSIVSVVGLALVASAARGPGDELVLAENGQSPYRIVLAGSASPATKHGANELQLFLKQMSGADLPIVSDEEPQNSKEIILGDNVHSRKLGVEIDFASLGKEGFVIRTVGESIVIAGGPPRGNLYGVYGFLEDHLGCRWFAPGAQRIPRAERLVIGRIDDCQSPAFEYREPFLLECFDGDWCARNRVNSSHANLEEKHGGAMSFGNGYFCHTFERLVPPDEYFDKHPEYFALVKGERKREQSGINAQLCCLNPDVVRICTEQIRKAMKAQPGATVFSLSQNDSYEPTPDNDRFEPGGCECEKCQAVARREDSQIAPVLQLVNHVAEAVEKDFPEKLVETLAYQWTRRPPKHMRPRPNVVIRLCSSGGCCCSHPLATCDSATSRAFLNDFEAWSKIAPRLWIWNYATDYNHYLLPLPNQRVLASNIRLFATGNAKGVFIEDTGDTLESELAALGGYLAAKALWNPQCDTNRTIDDFLEGYYGQAAGSIRSYIDLLHDRAQAENIHVGPLAECDSAHLTDELLTRANDLWQRAEELVAAEPDLTTRVRTSRMSVDYAILERARLQAQQKLPANEAHQTLAASRVKPFLEALDASHFIRMSAGTPLDKVAYRRDLLRDLKLKLE